MATFALICIDKLESSDLRTATREKHLAWVAAYRSIVRLAGPFLDEAGAMTGSLFIIEARDIAVARAFHAADPYTLAGLWGRVELHPWRATVGEVP